MLKNYGFDVHDLGKDVPTEEIIRSAKEFDADIIAVSALMTTTMLEMKEIVKQRDAAGLRAKIMIGGAVITQEYCDEIHADGYSKDAQEAVVVAKRLVGKTRSGSRYSTAIFIASADAINCGRKYSLRLNSSPTSLMAGINSSSKSSCGVFPPETASAAKATMPLRFPERTAS